MSGIGISLAEIYNKRVRMHFLSPFPNPLFFSSQPLFPLFPNPLLPLLNLSFPFSQTSLFPLLNLFLLLLISSLFAF